MPELREGAVVVRLEDGTQLVQVGWWCDDCIAAHAKRLDGTTHGGPKAGKGAIGQCGVDYGKNVCSHLNVQPLYAAVGDQHGD